MEWCCVQGSQSSCCEDCLNVVVASGVRITFHPVRIRDVLPVVT